MTEKKWRQLRGIYILCLLLILGIAVGNQLTGHGQSNLSVFVAGFVAACLAVGHLMKLSHPK